MKLLILFLLFATLFTGHAQDSTLPQGFVYLYDINPSIIQEIRYFTPHNFIGDSIQGYLAPQCILTTEAASALSHVQQFVLSFNMSLKVYDCYRPQTAVDHFVSWSHDMQDQRMKTEFYPFVNKTDLFPTYIATKSGHSRGSTLDLTIIPLPPSKNGHYTPGDVLSPCTAADPSKRFLDNSIDMGTGFDCFSHLAWTDSKEISAEQHKHRYMLKQAMEAFGFRNYEYEWWHFTLQNEPYPDTYFSFPVQ